MKNLSISSLAACILFCTGAAFAQSDTAMRHDTMSKNGMAKSTMSKDGMSHDTMHWLR
jgi:pentapeptide MXKDX repeat protein